MPSHIIQGNICQCVFRISFSSDEYEDVVGVLISNSPWVAQPGNEIKPRPDNIYRYNAERFQLAAVAVHMLMLALCLCEFGDGKVCCATAPESAKGLVRQPRKEASVFQHQR